MSRQFHRAIRRNLIRDPWTGRRKPVLINHWEATEMYFTADRLVEIAQDAPDLGLELFVMDDGWFGQRTDDTRSLGDWEPNPKKLPHGLKGLCDGVRALGLDFGIWVEPEMVNVKSSLYQAHPDWTMEIPGHAHSEGRHQRLLDLGK